MRQLPPSHRLHRRSTMRLETLEVRAMLTAGVQEEYLLELMNRMRSDPADELPLLLNSTDPNVIEALSYFQVNTTVLAQQWSALTPAPPLAYNDDLATSALNHSELMNQDDEQSHQLPGEADLLTRIDATGYSGVLVGENIYAYAADMFDTHAAFAIDWGNEPDGIQNPPGHRDNMMDASFQDVGFGIVAGGGAGKSTGPELVTEDFGQPQISGNPFLVGAVYTGTATDPYYSLSGEGSAQVTSNGLASVSITATSTTNAALTFSTTTTAAGGYQLQLPAGSYTVTFSGGGLSANVVKSVTVGTSNVLLNVNTFQNGLPTSSVDALPATSPVSFTVSWSGSDPGGPGIADYDVFVSDNGGPFTALLTATTATSTTFSGVSGHTYGFYSVAIDTAGRSQSTPTAAQATTLVEDDDANSKYVAAVYEDVLGRPVDADGLAYWTNQLDSGTSVSAVAQAIATSAEYYANFVIKPAYLNLLGRAADDAGIAYWTGQMRNGLTDQELEAGFVASAEFYASAGGTDAAWVSAIYRLLLGRTADGDGLTYWTGQLSAGVSRLAIAERIANSSENDSQLITADYEHYLGRAPDSDGLTYWLGQFTAGKTNEDIIAGFTGSEEFFAANS
ncbi:MAG TPA: DUF4214 domain-containing protein [Pirellulales bacterium]|nr:DUF4214 domain-containing protein [Pirellulales bacterium]